MIEEFINQFGGFTEPYFFYDGTVELRYDPKEHVYFLFTGGTDLERLDGVTTVCHVIDKSDALIPWACKMMSLKLLNTAPRMTLPTGEVLVPQMSIEDFTKLVLESKGAHKEKLEDAGAVGHAAHAWIEKYINSLLVVTQEWQYAPLPEDERAANCCRAALDWMGKHKVRWVCTERKIYSRSYGYAGTMDGKAYVSSCDDPLCCGEEFTDRLSVIDWKSSNYLYLEYLYQTAAYQAADNEEFGEPPVVDRWVIRLGKDDGEFEPWHLGPDCFEDDFKGFLFCLDLTRSVRKLKARMKGRTDAIRAEEKRKAKEAREAALKLACKNSSKYKGTRKPVCNGGDPCQSCLNKYADVQAVKDQDAIVGLNM